jgi:ribose/xylose/arabinose/galactoside ABC-type transport system permease subunit
VGARNDTTQSVKRVFGWIGIICLLLIIPVKASRFVDERIASTILVSITPSLLGPAGVFFLILSSSGRLSRLAMAQVAGLVLVIALALEFAQYLPRPGILTKVHYTFDWLDVVASACSVCMGYLVAHIVKQKSSREKT